MVSKQYYRSSKHFVPLAYIVCSNRQWCLKVNGRQGKIHEPINLRSVVHSQYRLFALSTNAMHNAHVTHLKGNLPNLSYAKNLRFYSLITAKVCSHSLGSCAFRRVSVTFILIWAIFRNQMYVRACVWERDRGSKRIGEREIDRNNVALFSPAVKPFNVMIFVINFWWSFVAAGVVTSVHMDVYGMK